MKIKNRNLFSRVSGWTVFAILPAFLLVGCRDSGKAKPQPVATLSGLHVQALRAENVPDEFEAPGTVVAAATAQVAARVMGTAVRVEVREGDHVRRGQPLVLLEASELAARSNAARAFLEEAGAGNEEATRALAAAQAQADIAGKTYERFVFLREKKSVSAQEFDEVEAKQRAGQAALAQAKARQEQMQAMRQRAEAELRAAEALVNYARVVAPFDGVVTRRAVEPGSLVSPGVLLFVVEDTARYQLEASVAASDLLHGPDRELLVHRGTSARVRLDALPDVDLAGKVAELEAGADPASHTVRLRIELPRHARMRSGLFGRAWFRCGERRAIVVPHSAILERGQLRGLYVVDASQTVRWRLVTLGKELADRRWEILSGVSEGDRIVLDPDSRELDGGRILAAQGAGGEGER